MEHDLTLTAPLSLLSPLSPRLLLCVDNDHRLLCLVPFDWQSTLVQAVVFGAALIRLSLSLSALLLRPSFPSPPFLLKSTVTNRGRDNSVSLALNVAVALTARSDAGIDGATFHAGVDAGDTESQLPLK